MKRLIIGYLLVMMLVFAGMASLSAQDATPTADIITPAPLLTAIATAGDVVVVTVETTVEPPAEPPTDALPPTTESPSDITGLILATLFAGAATIGGSIFVTALVGVLKQVIPATVVSSDTLKNIVSVVVWILYSLAIKFGLGTQFSGLATFLAPILTTLAPLVGVLIGSSKLYLAAKSAGVPLLGTSRKQTLT